jgi:large subunit ribosomal protein L3
MPTLSRPRKGSLQFYPRKRITKFLPSVNWRPLTSTKTSDSKFLGFIAYKVGMASAIIKDNTEHSLTKGKRVTIPVTILEAPSMKIFSIRFYKNSIPIKEAITSNSPEIKSKLKIPKTLHSLEKQTPKEYDDIRAIVYSLPQQTSIKKTPDLIELGIAGENPQAKLEFLKSLVGKELDISSFLKEDLKLFDVRGITKGKGTQGPVKRFGITLKNHKSEKGRRNPGSIAPWHPARVTFRTPMAGQLGLFNRIHYNLNLILSNKIEEKDINPKSGFKNYGRIKSSYIILKGSVQGPPKRQIVLTPSFRPSNFQKKKNFEFVELITKTK